MGTQVVAAKPLWRGSWALRLGEGRCKLLDHTRVAYLTVPSCSTPLPPSAKARHGGPALLVMLIEPPKGLFAPAKAIAAITLATAITRLS